MQTLAALEQRFSANYYDPDRPLSNEHITTMIDAARQAPSAFNLQNVRFMVVQDQAAREQLCGIALNQEKVRVAPAVFVILGDTRGFEPFPEIVQRDVGAGIFDQQMGDQFNNMVQSIYANDATKARDEAIRSGAMAAMNLMNAAADMGIATGPMIGFDPDALQDQFKIDARYEPVMMITAGYAAQGNWPKKTRLSIDELTVFDAKPGSKHALS